MKVELTAEQDDRLFMSVYLGEFTYGDISGTFSISGALLLVTIKTPERQQWSVPLGPIMTKIAQSI